MSRAGHGRPIPPTQEPVLTGEVVMPGDRRRETPRSDLERTLQLLALLTDNVFRLPGLGWRFGLDPLIGLFPIVGDLASALVSLYIMQTATQFDVPRSTLARMALNVAVDYLLGSIPLIGNVFDFWWKANYRNVQLLERALNAPVQQRRRNKVADWLFIGGVLLALLAVFLGSLVAAVLIANWIISRLS